MNQKIQAERQFVLEESGRHNELGREKNYNWIRTSITIPTPSLILLVGLEGNSLPKSCILTVATLSSIVAMTLTVLIGLVALHSEAKSHVLARDKLRAEWDQHGDLSKVSELVELPLYMRAALVVFPYMVSFSLLCISALGIIKVISNKSW